MLLSLERGFHQQRDRTMSTKSFTIDISEDVIRHAEPNSNHNCMVANALRSQLNAWSVVVDSSVIRFNVGGEKHRGECGPGTRYMWQTPAEVAAKVTEFDSYPSGEIAAENMEPFKVRLQGLIGFDKPIKEVLPTLHKKKRAVNQHRPRAASKFKRCARRYHGKNIIEYVPR